MISRHGAWPLATTISISMRSFHSGAAFQLPIRDSRFHRFDHVADSRLALHGFDVPQCRRCKSPFQTQVLMPVPGWFLGSRLLKPGTHTFSKRCDVLIRPNLVTNHYKQEQNTPEVSTKKQALFYTFKGSTWRPRGLANNIPLRRWIPGRCPSPRHPRNDPATSVPLRHTPSRKKSRWRDTNGEAESSCRNQWQPEIQKKNEKSHLIFFNNHSRRYIVRPLKFSKGVCNIVVREGLSYQQSKYQTCQKMKTSGSA